MSNEMTHQTVVLQCSNDVDLDTLFIGIKQVTDGANLVTYELDVEGQKTIEKALPAITHDFDFIGVTDDEQ
ncbi:hypothetical protein [Lacticaseibacillus saniviri]|uniref:Uncharacterized protein n=2 Tax=Lacticaseibacillus saniviri TaxID=931533 RepID=A0A0R2MNR1_9LACO|nr:hypothetical protein [Lacticaseibacillus saniviri]KRO15302.1 hypothetical protein IV56_GL000159 [Lacticaseibacillus saniviri JCM 17471 = DSM 24301]